MSSPVDGPGKPNAETQAVAEIKNTKTPGAEITSPPVPRPDFAAELVAADRRSRSWREKLDGVKDLLAREWAGASSGEAGDKSALRRLVDVAVYLRFLAAGEIPCVEDGRHFRPAHHSRISQ